MAKALGASTWDLKEYFKKKLLHHDGSTNPNILLSAPDVPAESGGEASRMKDGSSQYKSKSDAKSDIREMQKLRQGQDITNYKGPAVSSS